MPGTVQATWIQLSTGPDPQAAIATWWADARLTLFSPTILPVANATAGRQLPALPPAPSLPPGPGATGYFEVCSTGTVSVRWQVPAGPHAAAPPDEAVAVAASVSTTVTLPRLTIGAAPPASAGITQFPSKFSLPGYAGSPVTAPPQTRDGLTILLLATPVSYTWDFGDGTQVTTATPSAPVTHTYTQTSARSPMAQDGRYAVTVAVTFDTKFLATGPGAPSGWVDFSSYGLAPLVDRATLPYEVDQLYGVLVPSAVGG